MHVAKDTEQIEQPNPWGLDAALVEQLRSEVQEVVAAEKDLDEVKVILARRKGEWDKATQPQAGALVTALDVDTALADIEYGDAVLTTLMFRDRYCHDNSLEKTYRWAGTYWTEDTNRQAEADMREVAEEHRKRARDWKEKANQEADKNKKAALEKSCEAHKGRARQILTRTKANTIFKLATAGDGSLGVSGKEWEREPTLLACANGVIELETGRLVPGRPEQYLRKASPMEYHGMHVAAPFWEETLLKLFCRDLEVIDYIELVIGYASTGLMSFKDFYCCHGPGGDNGKSFLFDTIRWVLGEYAGTVPTSIILEDWGKGGGSGPNPDLLKLNGMRLCVFPEAKKNARFSMDTIKYLTGSDTISVRGLYQRDPIEFTPSAKPFLHTNWIPKVQGNDPAFFKRLRIIPFLAKFVLPGGKVQIAPEQHIYEAVPPEKLREMLLAEAPGILAWIVRCAHRFLATMDLTPPDKVLAAGEDYQQGQDMIGQWIDQCCDVSDKQREEQTKDLYASFCKWLQDEQGIDEPKKFIGLRSFGEDMQQRFERRKTNVVYYRGVRIRDDWRPEGPKQGEM